MPGRDQEEDDRMVGRLDLGVLRRHRRRRHVCRSGRVDDQARHGRQAVADLGGDRRRRGRQPVAAVRVRHRVHEDGRWQQFEYKGDDEKTQASRLDDFFTVGDVGYLDDDGFLFLNDRANDMIIVGGLNIYPAEIEGALVQHEAVGDVAVFGIPNADTGEEIKAVVELRDGWEPSDETTEAIMSWLRQQIARQKLPRTIDYTTEMPRDPNGKLYKRRLRDPYWEGQETAI